MDIDLKLEGEDLFSAQLQLLINILATQNATASMLCDKLTQSDEESDALYRSFQDEVKTNAKQILQNLYEQRGKIDLNDILGNE